MSATIPAQRGGQPGRCLRAHLPAEPLWLVQVHGNATVDAEKWPKSNTADASFPAAGVVCAVMTADCLPVLFCDGPARGRRRPCRLARAGWRGAGKRRRPCMDPRPILAWLGPAIGPQALRSATEVRAAFIADDAGIAFAWPSPHPGRRANGWPISTAGPRACNGHRRRTAIHGGGACTVSDPDRFFSYRRDGVTGRMASLIWLAGRKAYNPRLFRSKRMP
jgi:copper oxidase (laccase) domain-containing protein